MPRYTKQVPSGTDRAGNPTYMGVPANYKSNNARRAKKARKKRGGSAASNYKPKSSSESFFSALAIKK